ncbi:MAG: hypothetical protein R2688_05705 [Fimbriimonadaceae bacterium]
MRTAVKWMYDDLGIADESRIGFSPGADRELRNFGDERSQCSCGGITRLGEAAGRATRRTNQEIVVRAKDMPLQQFMDEMAFVTGGKWNDVGVK